MTSTIPRDEALELLRKYNKEPFHIQHGITVEKTMRWFAKELGYGDDMAMRKTTGGLPGFCMISILSCILMSTAGKLRSF